MPLPPARAARGAHASGAALWARGCVFWTENTCFFGQKSASMDPARLFRVYSMSYAQVQPAVPAVGALVIEQGRVGMGGGQRWNRPKIVKIQNKKKKRNSLYCNCILSMKIGFL